METCAGPREYQYDTLRFLLIALVVLGHLLELAEGFPHREFLYAVIYSFLMPAFLFLSGMFARFDRIHYIFGLALPYLLLQTLYTSFVHALGDPYVHVEFSRPYWLLWYLFALMVYTALLPVYDSPSRWGRGMLAAGSVVLALLVGCNPSIGYQWSASRIVAFQPWFLLGYYYRKERPWRERLEGMAPLPGAGMAAAAAACCAALEWLVFRCGISAKMMLGAYPYGELHYGWPQRLLIMCCAASAVFLLFVVAAPRMKRRLPLLTTLGQNSLSIYLLHGFLIQLLRLKFPSALRHVAGAGGVGADSAGPGKPRRRALRPLPVSGGLVPPALRAAGGAAAGARRGRIGRAYCVEVLRAGGKYDILRYQLLPASRAAYNP